MTEKNQTERSCGNKLLTELKELIDDLTMELRFRGCEDSHRLLQRARELRRELTVRTTP